MKADRRLFLLVPVALAALVGGVALELKQRPAEIVPPAVLAQLRDLPLQTLDGKPFTLVSLSGKTVVVNFWATWCAPCKEEMPDLVRLQTELAPRSVQFVGIGIDSADNMRAFAQKLAINYPLVFGTGATVSLVRALGNQIGALPYTIILNPTGSATFAKIGRILPEEIRDAVAAAAITPVAK